MQYQNTSFEVYTLEPSHSLCTWHNALANLVRKVKGPVALVVWVSHYYHFYAKNPMQMPVLPDVRNPLDGYFYVNRW